MSTPTGSGSTPGTATGRRRRLPWVLGVVALVVVAAAAAAVVLGRDGGLAGVVAGPAPTVTATVTAPVPTTTVAPAARPASTALTAVLPGTLRAHALTASTADGGWVGQGAVEAWSDAYDGDVAVRVGQWATPEEAAAVGGPLLDALLALGPEGARTGDVPVGGAAAGRYAVVDGAAPDAAGALVAQEGRSTAAWWNGTVVVVLSAPTGEADALWAAYPL